MTRRTLSRRLFLRGAGGFALSLPFLPSLLPREAMGAPGDHPKRFIAMATGHGGIWDGNMFPSSQIISEQRMYAGHEIRAGQLMRQLEGGRATISPVLSGAETTLTESITRKLNVIQGIDIPFYIAHHTGGHLGNYARNNADGDDGAAIQTMHRPTIDQIMAWSEEFYGPSPDVRLRSLVTGAGRLSYRYENPLAAPAQRGDIVAVQETRSSLTLFRTLFANNSPGDPMQTPIVDRVFENYQRLRQSNRRLSAQDRQRLDAHMSAVDEIQRRLNTTTSCADLPEPDRDSADLYEYSNNYWHSGTRPVEHWQLMNSVIAMAMACGTSRIATMNCNAPFSDFDGSDWHQEVAHQANGMTRQITQRDAHQRFFEQVFLDLVNKLEAYEDEPGTTVLDNSLVMWTQESGSLTHDSFSIPIVTAGSAGGEFVTGQFVDYRNMNRTENTDVPGLQRAPGLIYNQWLSNVLMAMGISPENFERDGRPGYGVFFLSLGAYNPAGWPTSVQTVMSERLPFITA